MKFLLLLFTLLFIPSEISAQSTVRINEVQIDPQQAVELINTGSNSIDISGWHIDDSGGSTYFTILGGTTIQPNACVVLSSNFNLNKASPDHVRLFDNTASPTDSAAILIDDMQYAKSPGEGISLSRIPDITGEFATKSATLGALNESGVSCQLPLSPTPTLTPILTIVPTITPTVVPRPSHTPTPAVSTIANIYISEVMAHPIPGDKEWVELYNDNNFDIELMDWYLDDVENGGTQPRLFSLTVRAKGHATIELTINIFNNTGDSVRILDSAANEIDRVSYTAGEVGKTFGRISFNESTLCAQLPSKNAPNNPCIGNSSETISLNSSTALRPPLPGSSPNTAKQTIASTLKSQPLAHANTPTFSYAPTRPSHHDENTLGVSSEIKHTAISTSKNYARTFSFLSTSYSLLTIFSVFLKMKIG